MEMCYDGALVMPKNYAIMSEGEMEYIEGGLSWEDVKNIGLGILAVCGACNTVMSMFNNAVKYGAAIKGITEAAFIQGVATKVAATISKITAWITSHLNIVAGVLAGLVAFAGGFYAGQKIAENVYAHVN